MKSGRFNTTSGHVQTEIWTDDMKIVITTCRDLGSASWIIFGKFSIDIYFKVLRCNYIFQPLTCSAPTDTAVGIIVTEDAMDTAMGITITTETALTTPYPQFSIHSARPVAGFSIHLVVLAGWAVLAGPVFWCPLILAGAGAEVSLIRPSHPHLC